MLTIRERFEKLFEMIVAETGTCFYNNQPAIFGVVCNRCGQNKLVELTESLFADRSNLDRFVRETWYGWTSSEGNIDLCPGCSALNN